MEDKRIGVDAVRHGSTIRREDFFDFSLHFLADINCFRYLCTRNQIR